MTDLVRISDRGHVRTVTLSRPHVKNALSDELAWSVVNAVDDAARDDDVWVIAITGSGDAFCAGLDLTMKERTSLRSVRRTRNSTTSTGSATSCCRYANAAISPWLVESTASQ